MRKEGRRIGGEERKEKRRRGGRREEEKGQKRERGGFSKEGDQKGGGVKLVLFFFNDTATAEIYTLSLHDALPILAVGRIECAAKVDFLRGHPKIGVADNHAQH